MSTEKRPAQLCRITILASDCEAIRLPSYVEVDSTTFGAPNFLPYQLVLAILS